MATATDIGALGAVDLALAIARGDLSALEAVEAHLARIEAVNPRLNAVVVSRAEQALAEARAADQRRRPGESGPLDGVPITVKESYAVTGAPSTAGIPSRAGINSGQETVANAAGPLARSVTDLELAFRVLAAPGLEAVDHTVAPVPLRDPAAVRVADLRVGVYDDHGCFPASAAVRRAVAEAAEALRRAGARVVDFRPPEAARGIELFACILGAAGTTRLRRLLAGAPMDPRLRDLVRLSRVPGVMRGALAAGVRGVGQRRAAELLAVAGKRSVLQYHDLAEQRRAFRAGFLAAMDEAGLDAILCPPCSVPAVLHGATRDLLIGSFNYAALYNLLAMPAGAVPVTRVHESEQEGRPQSRDRLEETARRTDLGSAGLPVGVQVAARHWREDVVLAVMAAVEAGVEGPGRPPL